MLLVTLLCTVFVLPLGLGNENRISQNFKNLFDAAAAGNDTNKRHELKELHESQREQEESFNAFDNEVKLMKEDRRIIYGDYRNDTTRRKKESVDKNAVFNEKRFNDALDDELENLNPDEKVKRLRKKLVVAEKEIFRLGDVVARKDEQKSLIAIPMEVLQVRDAIERRIDWLYGATGKPARKSYIEALEDAVTSIEKDITSNLRMREFRSVIRETGFEDMDSFVETVKVLYRDFSFGQAHKITAGIIKLPSYEDKERISKILKAAGARLDASNIKAIQAFLKPCEETGKKAPGENERCVIFKTTFQRHRELFKPEAKISKEDILLAFPEIEPLRAAWVSYTDKKQAKVYMIQVEFDTETNAKNGFNNNHGWLKKFKVESKLSPCYNEDSKDVVIEEIASRDDTVANPNGA